jgi:2-C-methyl-D-erythritol 4-phosphate cytidylyltransferase
MNKLGVVIVAAGKGSRMGTAVSKQYLYLQDKPVLIHTLEIFEAIDEVNELVVVVGKADISYTLDLVEDYRLSKVKVVIAGGEDRQSSVYKGIKALSHGIEWVMVHDGVRPLVTQNSILQLWKETKRTGAAVLGVPVKETIKVVDEAGIIESTPIRSKLWTIQTPQAFRLAALLKAHERAEKQGMLATDDSMLVEWMDIPVQVVEGDYENIKLTTPDDLYWAEHILKERRND